MTNMNNSSPDTGINTGIYRFFTPQEIQTATEQMNKLTSSRGVGYDMLMEHVRYMVAKNERTKL
ncbi:MAG: hypothetical protein PHN60_02340 [Candidatus Gracilibacteria bacterium]|nr:hypothetical protein [Candidatus Gracilibacteria bacterium]